MGRTLSSSNLGRYDLNEERTTSSGCSLGAKVYIFGGIGDGFFIGFYFGYLNAIPVEFKK